MVELERRMNSVAAFLLCASMLTGFLVLSPGESEAQGLEGWIVGHVADESSNPVQAYVLVMMMMSGGSPEGGFWTDGNGDYNVTVYGGLEMIVLAANGSYYVNSTIVTSVADEEVWANITMTPIAPLVADVTVTGFVKDTNGDPVTAGNVIGYTSDPAGEGMPLYANLSQPGLDGSFSINVISGVAGGGVGAFDFVGFESAENSTSEPFVSGMTYWLNLTLVAPVSTDDARISGHVYDASDGTPLANAIVQYSANNMWIENGEYSNFTFTDVSGYFEMNVTNGSADIWFSKSGFSMNMFENVEVMPGADLAFDAWLVPLTATIRGNVTDGKTGLGLGNARVFTNDLRGNVSMAITGGAGEYTLETFDGTGIAIGAETEGYSRNFSFIDVAPGETLWIDFVIWPVDAWMNGTVVDRYNGTPVANAHLQMRSMAFERETDTNAMGEYNFTGLVSGDYVLNVWASDYQSYNEPVTVSPGANTQLVELTPWNIPDTCMLYGWVNDSDSGSPIGGAQISVGISAIDHSEHNQTWTDGAGYYEMWVPPMELIWLANASDHEHAQGTIDASVVSEIELDVALVPDSWAPNITSYDQSPLENISIYRPTVFDIEFDEDDLGQIVLWEFVYWYTAGPWEYYYNIHGLYTNFNPLASPSNSLPYTVIGNHYTVDTAWAAQTSGGYLWNLSASTYLPSWEVSVGPDTYDALRGLYKNGSQPSWQPGTMFFERATGLPYTYQFDMGGEAADLSDPTGVFSPEGLAVQRAADGSSWWYVGTQQIGDWSVQGLYFDQDPTVPSGQYFTVFGVSDWGNHGWAENRLITVDTNPPVAEAGPDQIAEVGISMTLDGANSTDNVDIANWEWEYVDDLGQTVYLYGESVFTTFNAVGSYVVTLTVWDFGGNQASDTMTVTVIDSIPPVAEAGPDQFVMVGEVVYFDGSASTDNAGVVNWTWTFTSDGVNYELWGENVSFMFGLDPETVTVTLTVTDAEGNSGSDTLTVNVSGVIPEFPALVLPVVAMLGVVAILARRRR